MAADLWAIEVKPSALKRFYGKLLRFCYLVVTEFLDGQCVLKASALTFISLVSLVPLLAFILSVSKGLGAEKALEQKIDAYIFMLPGGDASSLFTHLKKRLFKQIKSLDFSKPSIQKELLHIIENFDKPLPSEENNSLSDAQKLSIPHTPGLLQGQFSNQSEIRDAIEDYKIELSVIVNSMDLTYKNAKKDMKERFENAKLSISQNISLSAFQFKSHIMDFVNRTSFGYLGTIGLLTLLYIVIRTLGNVEMSFNDIWKVKKSRSIFRKFTDYTSMLIIVPILLLASTTVTAVLTHEKLVAFLHKMWIAKLYLTLLGWFLPIVALWMAFISVYMFLPNTKVKIIPGMLGGMAGGTVFYILQTFFLKSQIGLSRYNVIYGAFAAIPFFLVWLQTSWAVVLFGAVISYVIQNINTLKPKNRYLALSYASRELLGLIIMERICSQFLDGKGEKWSSARLSKTLNVHPGLVHDILHELSKAALILEIPAKQGIYYIPDRDPGSIYVMEVLNTLRSAGEKFEPVHTTLSDQRIAKFMEDMQIKIQKSTQISLKDIVLDEK